MFLVDNLWDKWAYFTFLDTVFHVYCNVDELLITNGILEELVFMFIWKSLLRVKILLWRFQIWDKFTVRESQQIMAYWLLFRGKNFHWHRLCHLLQAQNVCMSALFIWSWKVTGLLLSNMTVVMCMVYIKSGQGLGRFSFWLSGMFLR